MFLTEEERRMCDGEYGPGVQMAMNLLVKYGDAFDAEGMVEVASAHITTDGVPTDMLVEMTEGAHARVMATQHASFNPAKAKDIGITWPPEVEHKRIERYEARAKLFREAGFLPTSTCAPYLVGDLPYPGAVLSWHGSSGQIIANSVFGARVSRDGGSAILAAAITGRIPYMRLLKPENRHAKLLFKLGSSLEPASFTEATYAAIGYYIGGIAEERNVVIDGLPRFVPFDVIKYLFAPMPTSGAVTLCHVVGMTPEAATLEQALGNKKPEETIVVGKKEIEEASEELTTTDSRDVDMVAIGCPHCSISEVWKIASLLEGKKVSQNVRLIIGTAPQTYFLAQSIGYANIIEEAGGFFTACCVAMDPFRYARERESVVATNSARAAHYAPRQSECRVFLSNMQDCISCAITGKRRS